MSSKRSEWVSPCNPRRERLSEDPVGWVKPTEKSPDPGGFHPPSKADSRSSFQMIPDSLLSRDAIAGQPGPSNDRPAALGLVALLGLAAWCGTVAGLLEVVAVVVRKRFFDTNQLMGMSRHFTWLVPLTDLLIFLLVGLIGTLIVMLRPAGGRWAVARTLCALTLLPMLLRGLPAGLRPGLGPRGPGSLGPLGPHPGAAQDHLPVRGPFERSHSRRYACVARGVSLGGRPGPARA